MALICEPSAAARIREAASRGALSHALLFTGPGDRLAAARFAAAAHQGQGPSRPFGAFPACRKVEVDIHPDVITVRDPEHKNISVDVVRDMRADAYIQPNEGARKVYLFPDCSLLTEQDQNVLLKVVEEGPPYAAFLFCAENRSQVLPTLRSRCVELLLPPAAEEGETPETGEDFCRRIAGRRRGAVTEWAVQMERQKLDRETLAEILAWSREAFAGALLVQYGCQPEVIGREIAPFLAKNLTKGQIMSTIELLETYHGACAYNVGTGHVLGALAAELEGIL